MIADLLSDAAPVHASSPKILERGKNYASSDAVSIVAIVGEDGDLQPAIHGEVAGTQIYKTSVRGSKTAMWPDPATVRTRPRFSVSFASAGYGSSETV